MDDRKLTPVAVLLSDDDGIAELDRARNRRLMAEEKERIIRQDQAAWYDPDEPMSWSEKKARLWDISKGRCYYCGTAMNPFRDFSVDHDVPRSKGGPDDFNNLVACCRTCNTRKNARSGDDWLIVVNRRRVRR